MNKLMREYILPVSVGLLLSVAIGGCKYKAWRAAHPSAPTWSYFFGG